MSLRATIKSHGGTVRFMYKAVRFVSCVALLGITIAAFIVIPDDHRLAGFEERGHSGVYSKHWGKNPKRHRRQHVPLTPEEWQELSLCVFYVSFIIYVAPVVEVHILLRRHILRSWLSYR